jgi:hypothetical protein
VLPFQSPPDQVLPDRLRGAHVSLSKGVPKMSLSPVRATPPSET